MTVEYVKEQEQQPVPVDVRKAMVDILNFQYAGANAGDAPMKFANDLLDVIGEEPLVEVVTASVDIPVEQDWRGDVDIDVDAVNDNLLAAVWDDQAADEIDKDDLELDTAYGYGSITVQIDANVKAVLRVRELEVELEDDSIRLEDALVEQADYPADWYYDPTRSITIHRAVRKFA